MLKIGGRTVLLGGFHDHWARTNTDNPALLIAALNYYHYDFMCLMDGEGEAGTARAIEAYLPGVRIYVGQEEFMGWGHVITVGRRQPRVILEPDFAPSATFKALRAANGFVAMAHPPVESRGDKLLMLEEVGELMDQGVIEATQYCPDPRATEWLRKRDAAGKLTPIVSGWDAHLVVPLPGLPTVLYSSERPPAGHIDTAGDCRTLVLAEENSFPAICAAVLRGDSLVENLRTGELVGQARHVRFLEENGYRKAVEHLDARRDACRLEVDRPPLAGEPASFRFSSPGEVRLPGTLQTPSTAQTASDGTLETAPLPALLERDATYLPVVKTEPDGYVRAWAVEVSHPVQLDILPMLQGAQAAIELRPSAPFCGRYRLQIQGAEQEIQGDENRLIVPFPGAVPAKPVKARLEAISAKKISRSVESILTYAQAPKMSSDLLTATGKEAETVWKCAPTLEIAEDCAPLLKSQYGANRPYPGRDVFSATAQFAWTAEELVVRMKVVDAVHHQPIQGHYFYHGDSVQLAVDPWLKREEGLGAISVHNFCLGPQGPEVFRWHRPDDNMVPGYKALPANVSLGGQYLKVDAWERGLLYLLRLPWAELAIDAPVAGQRLGLYIILMNNDGQGLLDTLHWPVPQSGLWLVPRRWGVLTLSECVKSVGQPPSADKYS